MIVLLDLRVRAVAISLTLCDNLFSRSSAMGKPTIEFRKLDNTEMNRLREALQGNAEGKNALLMNPRDTTFMGTDGADAMDTENLITTIKSIPCHY